MSKNAPKKIRVGIIGANPDRGWAVQAHIPALKSLPDDFEITAVSTSRRESADAASKLFGVPLAFDNHQDLVSSADVGIVAITVKVPHHFELATAALAAGKAVYCEWPLGNGLKEAEDLAALAKKQGVLAVAGLQARSAPSVAYVHDLIQQGYVGEVLSTTLIGSGMGWGPTVEPYNAYLNDKKNGATMLSIGLGHAADVIVCWENDWPPRYRHLEIIELKSYVGALPRVFAVGCDEKARGDVPDRWSRLDWSVPGNAQVGDLIVMYRTHPASEIRDLWKVVGPFDTDPVWGPSAGLRVVVRLRKLITYRHPKVDPTTRSLAVVRGRFQGKRDITDDWPLLYSKIVALNPIARKALREHQPD